MADYASSSRRTAPSWRAPSSACVEIDLRIKSLEGQYRQQASDQLPRARRALSELEQEQRKSVDASERQVIVAPAAGDVINLKFTTPGAVIAPRETIADIVPVDPRLVVEAHIRTEDVSRVQQGQQAEIRFTAFNGRTTQLVAGKVFYVAADRLVDPVTNLPYYVALIEADAASLEEAGDLKLQAGMPAEVYLKGEERTACSTWSSR